MPHALVAHPEKFFVVIEGHSRDTEVFTAVSKNWNWASDIIRIAGANIKSIETGGIMIRSTRGTSIIDT